MLETAAQYNRPPSRWLGNRGDWLDKDYALTLAHTLYTDGMCTCGHPRHECMHPDNDGEYEAVKVVCNAQAAIDLVTSVKDYKPEPGERFYTKYIRETPLPPLRTGPSAPDRGNDQADDHTEDDGWDQGR